MASKHERVGIIVPLYNAVTFLEETITSLLAQEFSDTKIYIVDDFSTDGSKELAQALAAKYPEKVAYHLMPKKGGCPAPTKNEGVRLTEAEYVAFCDHDDWWHPAKLTEQVAYLDSHPTVTILGCNVEIIDTDRHISLGTFWQNPDEFNPATARQRALDAPIFASTTCMIGRRTYFTAHPFDEQFMGSDEYDLSLHAVLDDPEQVALIPNTLAYWRWHSKSLSHSNSAAERALQDETAFAQKLLNRGDLTPSETAQVNARLTMVLRRAANAALDGGNATKARQLYKQAASRGDRLSKFLLILTSYVPPLARTIVSRKRSLSHAKPAFR